MKGRKWSNSPQMARVMYVLSFQHRMCDRYDQIE